MEGKTLDYEIERELELKRERPQEERAIVDAPPVKQSKLGRNLILLAVVIAIAGAALYFWMHSMGQVSTDDAQVDGHIAPVASRIPGIVAEILVNDNQRVKKGDVLVRLDPRDYQVKVDQSKASLAVASSQAQGASAGVPITRETTLSGSSSAEAMLSAAQADYERAKVDYERSANADISGARANVDAAQANFDRANADLNRMKPLLEKTEISKLQYDSYVAAQRVAESGLRAAQDKLTAATQDSETKKSGVLAAQAHIAQARAGVSEAQANQKQVNVRVADAQSAGGNVELARANLEAAELNLSYATMVAPMDGVVTRKSVEVGQMIQPGQGLMMIVPLQDVWVTANFKETQLAGVRPGQKVEVKVDLTGQTYSGHVDSISSTTGARMSVMPPENATGNYVKVVQRIPVKIVLDPISGGNNLLRPGMNVDATIFTK